jgi:hypothetical protein
MQSPLKKLANQLQDARMSGDTERVTDLQSQVDALMKLAQRSSNVDPISVNNLLNDDNASAIKIYNFLTTKLDEDWWEWEMETIERMLFINYGTALEDINRDKVYAIKHLCNSDAAFTDWYEFNQLALSFSGVMADFEYLKMPTPGMVVNCVRTMRHIRPDGEYNDDVKKYISIIFIENGIYLPGPSIVEVVNDMFPTMVSDEIKKLWKSIIARYKEFVGGAKDVKETVEDIQAKRLLIAEGAGVDYGI